MADHQFPHDSTSTGWLRRLAILGCACATVAQAGCGGGGKSSPLTEPSPPTQVAPVVEPAPAPLPPPIREVQPKTRSKVKVIDPGDAADQPQTLIEASRLAKARKAAGLEEPVHEITDENLKEFGEGAEIIMIEGQPAAQLPTEAELAASGSDIRGEEYWRNRGLDLRMSWRRTIDEIASLQLESAALRQQFYAEDDPYIRDSQIKPNLDRVLDRINSLQTESKRYADELSSYVDEGRQAGALQSWLNEGWELEPTDSERLRFMPGVGQVDSASEPDASNPGVDIGDTGNGNG